MFLVYMLLCSTVACCRHVTAASRGTKATIHGLPTLIQPMYTLYTSLRLGGDACRKQQLVPVVLDVLAPHGWFL